MNKSIIRITTIKSAIVCILLAIFLFMVVIPYIPYAMIRGVMDSDYFNDWKNGVFKFMTVVVDVVRRIKI